jgi:hypothetical protein
MLSQTVAEHVKTLYTKVAHQMLVELILDQRFGQSVQRPMLNFVIGQ